MSESACACTRTRRASTLEAVLGECLERLRRGEDRIVRFPHLRARLGRGVELISTFSHLTPNLPVDEVWGHAVLRELAAQAGFDRDQVLNVAYDNYIPRTDAPKAYTLQFGVVNPKALDPYVIPSLQERFVYDRRAFLSADGQNRVKSAPEQHIAAFRARFDELDKIFARHAGEGRVSERLLALRRDLLGLLGLDFLPEVAYSRALQPATADILEGLEAEGFPFWELPVPEQDRRYVEQTFFIEGIAHDKRRVPVRFDGERFRFPYRPTEERVLAPHEVYEAMRRLEVIPTMPLVILTLVTAPQMPHLGGRIWEGYAPAHVDLQAQWLGVPERSDTLILSTGGCKPLSCYRHNEEFIGFPVLYMTYGPLHFRRALVEGFRCRVEFKRRVLA